MRKPPNPETRKERKEMVFTIEYRVDLEDAGAIGEVPEKMREQGSAEILDAGVEPLPSN